jgi:chitinase
MSRTSDRYTRLSWRHNISSLFAILALSMCLPIPLRATPPPAPEKQIIAYIFPRDRIIAPGEVAAGKVTRINYAFANLQNGVIVEGSAHDAENFAVLNSLKKENPKLTVLVSVGGWTWSGNFSDMALTKQSRHLFIESAAKFVERYNLDGLDIDWEYPGLAGNNNKFRPEDKQNYTLLLKELRERFNHEEKKLHRHLVTSIATGASTDFLEHTEMGKVQRYVDTVNLMSYDYYVPVWDKTTGHSSQIRRTQRRSPQTAPCTSMRTLASPQRRSFLASPFTAKVGPMYLPPTMDSFSPARKHQTLISPTVL